MAKKFFDFNVGLLTLAPSQHDAHKEYGEGKIKIKEETEKIKNFKQILKSATQKRIDIQSKQFPTEKPIFIFVLQYFVSKKKWESIDLDNIAKPILDAFEDVVYKDDSQVKTLLMEKRVNDKRIPENFLYISIKEQGIDIEGAVVKKAGVEQAFALFQEIERQQRKRNFRI